MNKRNRLTIGIIAAVFLLACSAISLPALNEQPTQAATRAPIIATIQAAIPTTAPQQPTSVLLSDDFSVVSSEFEPFTDDSGSGETKDGVFVVRSTSELWNWIQSKSEFNDTVSEFDATMINGPANDNAGFGLICRLQSRTDGSVDGYLLAISGDGFYSIRSIDAGSMTALVDWAYSDAVNQGNQNNKIRATCNGSELKLEVNGELLATASANTGGSQTGGFAFALVSFETSELVAEVHFDNLVVSKP